MVFDNRCIKEKKLLSRRICDIGPSIKPRIKMSKLKHTALNGHFYQNGATILPFKAGYLKIY